jgi:4'-phosphopantetheinyl transferase
MSLFLKKALNEAAIGVWEISEDVEELYAKVQLSDQEKTHFSLLKSPQRRQHWLSYRLILPHLVQNGEETTINYDENGKPFLQNGVRHISVSHSGKFSALIASPTRHVGIDIECMQPKIFRLAHKFLNRKELKQVFSKHALESLYLIWASKEALFKLYGKRNLHFRENIRIFPFKYKGKGSITGEIRTKEFQRTYTINYQTIENYIMVYAIDKQE